MSVRRVTSQSTVPWCAGAKLEMRAKWVQGTLQLNPRAEDEIAVGFTDDAMASDVSIKDGNDTGPSLAVSHVEAVQPSKKKRSSW